jgi:hypothetical protein
VSATARQLIGREDELATIDRLLEAPARLPLAVVLHGAAGVGKTSLWLAGVEAALERGYRVMSCRPSEVEARLSYTGVTDLLGGTVDDVLPELPPLQRRALEAALVLGEPDAASTLINRVGQRRAAPCFSGRDASTVARPGPRSRS